MFLKVRETTCIIDAVRACLFMWTPHQLVIMGQRGGWKHLTGGTAGLLLLRRLWAHDLNGVGPWKKEIPTRILKGAWGSVVVFFFFSFFFFWVSGRKRRSLQTISGGDRWEPVVIQQHSRQILTLINLITGGWKRLPMSFFMTTSWVVFIQFIERHDLMRCFFLNSIITVIYGTFAFQEMDRVHLRIKTVFGKAPADIYSVRFTILFLSWAKELLPPPSRERASIMFAGISSLNDSNSTFS